MAKKKLMARLQGQGCSAFLLRCPETESPGAPFGAMAWVNGRTRTLARLGMVFTPPDLRGRGLGKAVTALLCEALLDASSGAGGVVLFADDANPVSNHVYKARCRCSPRTPPRVADGSPPYPFRQSLGFALHSHRRILKFSPQREPSPSPPPQQQ